jgi:hypothetical protein
MAKGKGGRKPQFKLFEKSPNEDVRHIRITVDMMESKAWKELSVHAIVLYCYMKTKYNKNNENNIMFKQDEGEKLMARNTFTKSIDQLIDFGFIRLVEHHIYTRFANIYGFTNMWQFYGTSKFIVKNRTKSASKKLKD